MTTALTVLFSKFCLAMIKVLADVIVIVIFVIVIADTSILGTGISAIPNNKKDRDTISKICLTFYFQHGSHTVLSKLRQLNDMVKKIMIRKHIYRINKQCPKVKIMFSKFASSWFINDQYHGGSPWLLQAASNVCKIH